MAMTPRHLVNFAPSLAYSSRRSRRPSRPSVTCSPVGARQRLRAEVHLDAGDDVLASQHVDERAPVVRALPKRLVVQNDATDVLARALRAKEQLSPRPPAILRRLDANGNEAPCDGARALVGGQDAAPRCDQRPRDAFQRVLPRLYRHGLFRLPRSYGACNICSTRSTASAFPTMSGVRSWTASGCRSRIRSAPLLALPPACSAT